VPEPTIIEFWFDAVCPWTWRTANWLRAAAAARDVEVRWRPMSLYKLNVEEAGVAPDTAAAGDDPSWDEPVYRSHAEDQAAMGDDSGSPILRPEGCRAVFGPVPSSPPGVGDGVRQFEGILATAATAEFAEMKRPRD
jgi:hypothetical protein